MYRAREKQMSIYDYLPPYHGELCNANRWVRLAAAIDWDGFEKAYSALFAPGGKVALPARVARELHRRGAVLVPHGGAVPRPHSG